MAFTLPNFNIVCQLWHYPRDPTSGPADQSDVPCNFSTSRATLMGRDTANMVGVDLMYRALRVPATVDIRCTAMGPGLGPDIVEVPQGTGAYYQVQDLATMGQGFPNAHRYCWVVPAPGFPLPTPLP